MLRALKASKRTLFVPLASCHRPALSPDQNRSLTHGFANLFPLGGGSAVATTELVSALRAHLSRV